MPDEEAPKDITTPETTESSTPVSSEIKPPVDPADPSPFQAPVITGGPKKKKGLVILIVVLVVALLAVGGYFAYTLFFAPKDTSSDTPETTVQTPLTKFGDAIKADLSGTITEKDSTTGPPYKLAGDDYLTIPGDDAEIFQAYSAVESEEAMLTEKSAVEKVFEDNNLKVISTFLDGSEGTNYFAKWGSDAFVCSLGAGGDSEGSTYDDTLKKYVYNSYITSVVCANVSDYTASAAEMKPFFAAFKVSNPDAKDNVLSHLKVVDSKTAGYKIATVSIYGEGAFTGGYAGMFYQTPDETWHYLTGTQQALLCSQFNTDDLKKAYLGETCYEANGQSDTSTVKL